MSKNTDYDIMRKQRPMKTTNRNIHSETKEDYISRPNVMNMILIFEYLLSILTIKQ